MGDEISRRFFAALDFSQFRSRLDDETQRLRQSFERGDFSDQSNVAGFELEAWIVDRDGMPQCRNDDLIERMNNPLVVPELARFNIELNGSPTSLTGRAFTRLYDELSATWSDCRRNAEALDLDLVTIGILPTAQEDLFTSENMSAMVRYQSLNDRVMALRDGRPIELRIEGSEDLNLVHSDVMLEAAATSFQIHLQCGRSHAVRDFNSSVIVSAPMVAVAANSPYLFGHGLWDETRIPLFEQAVDVGSGASRRVSFGDGYVTDSLLEIFEDNAERHSILIPMVHDTPPERFQHVRFHNGTLWRWNRPLIGFDFDGQVHLRIEHRVVAAGPTLIDSIANAAFFYGLVRALGLRSRPMEDDLPFDAARDNFYNAARYGLNARTRWVDADGRITEQSLRSLISEQLLPEARLGLQSLNLPDAEIDQYLDIIGGRVENSQNGAAWQRRWIAANGTDFKGLVAAYLEQQNRDLPVHQWPI
jgi:gamma-glutamyl:cysteine ligase YbdK (ATP-grasp superfamily)